MAHTYKNLQLAELGKLRKRKESTEKNLEELNSKIQEMEEVLLGEGPDQFAVNLDEDWVEALKFIVESHKNPTIVKKARILLDEIAGDEPGNNK